MESEDEVGNDYSKEAAIRNNESQTARKTVLNNPEAKPAEVAKAKEKIAENKKFADEGAKKFPNNPNILNQAAISCLDNGDVKCARSRAERGIEKATEKHDAPALAANLGTGLRADFEVQDTQTARRHAEMLASVAPDGSPEKTYAVQALEYIKSLEHPELKMKAVKPDFGQKSAGGVSGPAVAQGDATPGARAQGRAASRLPLTIPSAARKPLDDAHRALLLGDLSAADKLIGQAKAADPKSPEVWSLSGKLFNLRKDYAAAIIAAKTSLELAPGNAPALREQAIAEYHLGRYEDARVHAQAAVASDAANALGYLYLGMALEKLGKKDQALTAYQEAKQLDPSLALAFASPADAARRTRARSDRRTSRARRTAAGVGGIAGASLLLLALRRSRGAGA